MWFKRGVEIEWKNKIFLVNDLYKFQESQILGLILVKDANVTHEIEGGGWGQTFLFRFFLVL